jgi:hypothetical protein
MTRTLIIAGLIIAIGASIAGFPFDAADANDWSGFLFVVFALALFMSVALLAFGALRERDDVTALGFGAVAVYAIGTTLNSSLLARGEAEISVGLQPGIWGALVLGFLLIGLGNRYPGWIRIVAVASAMGHAFAATALLFGAEMPHTGAQATDLAPMVVAISKLLFWVVLVGLVLDLWKAPAEARQPTQQAAQSP